MILNLNLNEIVNTKFGWSIPINFAEGGVAATLKTSHDCAKNITHPEGGRAQMGILEIYKNE